MLSPQDIAMANFMARGLIAVIEGVTERLVFLGGDINLGFKV